MPFEINTLQQNQNQILGTPDSSRVAAQRTEKPKSDVETRRSAAGETVSLTDTASRLQRLSSEIESQPVVDSERVEGIRQAIENGSYEIDAERIARKMVDLERELV
jgi:negative regulator of flagellin synthesis FlgM